MIENIVYINKDIIPFKYRGRCEWWEIDNKEIELYNNRLGHGSVGIIHLAKWRGLVCACKKLNNNNEKDNKDLKNELELISHLRHPNLVLFLGACTINEPLLLLYEYMENGSIDKYYNNKSKKNGKLWIPKSKIMYRWIYELSSVIYFLHNCTIPIMHRDIKPSNILLSNTLHIKITDLGLSKTIKENNEHFKMSGNTGTLRYMAPEIIDSIDNYDLKIDVYSLSLNIWYIYTGQIPYNKYNADRYLDIFIKAGYRPEIALIKCDKLSNLILKMWNNNPNMRPDMREVFDKIKEIDFKELKNKKNISCFNFNIKI